MYFAGVLSGDSLQVDKLKRICVRISQNHMGVKVAVHTGSIRVSLEISAASLQKQVEIIHDSLCCQHG